jgi:hypothetical protein
MREKENNTKNSNANAKRNTTKRKSPTLFIFNFIDLFTYSNNLFVVVLANIN